jgi:peptidoglycan lytic transglycosylase
MYDACEMPLDVVSPSSASLSFVRTCGVLVLLASVAGCASHRGAGSAGASASRGMYKVGAPYTIDGVTYTPMEEFAHVETGIGSWYGPGFHGKHTANGEVYDQSDRTAAHRTLQMPSVVRVTNLDNGRSTVVRINDRGPYARGRVIDVSRAAAEELNMTHSGTAHVRIEQLGMESQALKDIAMNGGGPDEQRTALDKFIAGRRGPPPVTATAQAVPPPPPPTAQPAPPPPVLPSTRSPAVTPFVASGNAGQGSAPSASPTVASLVNASAAHPAGGFYVQIGAFSTVGNAEKQRGLLSSYGSPEISQASSGGREVYRVRLGPYTTSDAAGIVADRLKRSGYGDARVVAD